MTTDPTTHAGRLDADELLHLVLHAIQNKDTSAALRAAKELTANFPEEPRGHFLLGAMQAEIGLFDHAIPSFERAVTLDPTNLVGFFQLGLAHALTGNLPKADAAWRQLEPLGDEDSMYLFARGMRKILAGDRTSAILDMERSLAGNVVIPAMRGDIERVLQNARNDAGSTSEANDEEAAGTHVLLSAYSKADPTQH